MSSPPQVGWASGLPLNLALLLYDCHFRSRAFAVVSQTLYNAENCSVLLFAFFRRLSHLALLYIRCRKDVSTLYSLLVQPPNFWLKMFCVFV